MTKFEKQGTHQQLRQHSILEVECGDIEEKQKRRKYFKWNREEIIQNFALTKPYKI
jgi:hypothetical protein